VRYALVNPNWSFEGSVYFGCREPHLPLEFGYALSLLEREGHEVLLIDAHLFQLSSREVRERVKVFAPDFTVITTAPSYLFWRCPPPELRVPQEAVRNLGGVAGSLIAVGPHGSTSPETTLQKLGAEMVIRGEFEGILPLLAFLPREEIPSLCHTHNGRCLLQGGPHAVELASLPALSWPGEVIEKHRHHHHRFDGAPRGPGAEMETSRGCPYHCDFCAKENFRTEYRTRPLPVVLKELDRLLAQGVEYVYFVDELFLPDQAMLKSFCRRPFKFGVQMRMDLWNPELIELLGEAGCVSVEAGVESISEQGQRELNKKCRLDLEELTDLLFHAKRHIAFVQANLVVTPEDDTERMEEWRSLLIQHGVWANKPVPLFPYPGSPFYSRLWGPPDDRAWERAHAYYLSRFSEFSDIQDQHPLSLNELESLP
jgi:anaerobic magnesium-protoporphyrin IX monomethyl ester cyclase